MERITKLQKMYYHLNELRGLVESLPYKGDRCEDSQKICLRVSLNDVEACINGLRVEDFFEDVK